MVALFFIFRKLLGSLYYGKTLNEIDVYRGFKLYKNQPRKHKKSLWKIFIELEKLSIYWQCFPDTYFRFGMFMRSYHNQVQMKSFIPQAAYMKKAGYGSKEGYNESAPKSRR